MKNIMARAWEIARDAAFKFGGKVKEYFQQALVAAWAEYKKNEKAKVEWAKMIKKISKKKYVSTEEKGWNVYTGKQVIEYLIAKYTKICTENWNRCIFGGCSTLDAYIRKMVKSALIREYDRLGR